MTLKNAYHHAARAIALGALFAGCLSAPQTSAQEIVRLWDHSIDGVREREEVREDGADHLRAPYAA